MMNTEDFVTYEQAVALKDLGFTEACLYHYSNTGLLFSNSYSDGEGCGIYVEDLMRSYNSRNNKNHIDTPTLSQVQNWLMSIHNIFLTVDIYFLNHSSGNYEYSYIIVDMRETGKAFRKEGAYNKRIWYKKPAEAVSAGIDECLKLLTSK